MQIETPQPQDTPSIVRVAHNSGVFNSQELCVVQELLDAYFHPEPRDDHTFLVYRNGDAAAVVGFACFGPIALAERVWDLYWICVERAQQSNGIGSALLGNIEQELRSRRARAIYLETSDSPAYKPARDFYESHGYQRAAHLADFYAPGEGKVVYTKTLGE